MRVAFDFEGVGWFVSFKIFARWDVRFFYCTSYLVLLVYSIYLFIGGKESKVFIKKENNIKNNKFFSKLKEKDKN